MILYDSNDLTILWKLEGSVIPKSLVFSIPSVVLTVCSHVLMHGEHTSDQFKFLDGVNTWSVVWSGCVIVLGMLLGVRTNKAYGRFWEGITLVQQMRAEWFEAASNLMAFSMVARKKDKAMTNSVNEFQYVLIRLMSLMHGAALRQIGGNEEEFDVLDIQSLDEESLRYLAVSAEADINRVEVILHWIQVLVTDGAANGVIVVAPPILTRAYQTLSRGMVNLHNARKLADVPFPFPLSQMTLVLLVLQSVFTPFVVSGISEHVLLNVFICFVPVFGMWGLTFVAGELEQPFGSDPNDLPLSVLQYDFNTTLLMLLDTEASRAPHLVIDRTRTYDELKDCLHKGERFDKTNFAELRYAEETTIRKEKKAATGNHHDVLAERAERKKHRRLTITSDKFLSDAHEEDFASCEASECASNFRICALSSECSSSTQKHGPSKKSIKSLGTITPSISSGVVDFSVSEEGMEVVPMASTPRARVSATVSTSLLRETSRNIQARRGSNQPETASPIAFGNSSLPKLDNEAEDDDEIPEDSHRTGPSSQQIPLTPPQTP